MPLNPFHWCLLNLVLKHGQSKITLLPVGSFWSRTNTNILEDQPTSSVTLATLAIRVMPELSRLPAQLSGKPLEVQRGAVLPRVPNSTPVHRLVNFQPPGRRCQLQLCLLSLEGTWWCTSSQVYTWRSRGVLNFFWKVVKRETMSVQKEIIMETKVCMRTNVDFLHVLVLP